MTVPFMRAYSQLTIKTCHKRGAHAIGGMAAQIPVKGDPEQNEKAYAAVKADKEREVNDGHDGTWVAHPGMVPTAKEAFDEGMPQANQIEEKPRDDFHTTAEELLARPDGNITEQGFRNNISVGIQYLGAWLAGRGAVPVYNLMEDAATAEISRAQVWQWIHHKDGILEDGRNVDTQLFRQLADEELLKIREMVGEERFKADEYERAANLFDEFSTSEEFVSFLTIPAYEYLD
jgi:malate synthase